MDISKIITASGLHPSRVFNIYLFGSRIYGTSTPNSDWDVVIVANNSIEAIEIKAGELNIHIFTPDKFQKDLDWHMPKNLECYLAPHWAILKEDKKFQLKLDLNKLRHSASHVSSNSWLKAKKKLLIADEYNIGIKSLFHSIRIPMFATQIANTRKIEDFSCANFIWDKLKSKDWTWEELDLEFRDLRNKTLTEFRKVATKD